MGSPTASPTLAPTRPTTESPTVTPTPVPTPQLTTQSPTTTPTPVPTQSGTTPPTKNTLLSAYWDYGSCGPHGDNHNWDWCGTWRFRCPEMRPVPTELCASGNAVLVETKYFQKIGNCPYAYYAQYACGGAADSSSKRKGFLAP